MDAAAAHREIRYEGLAISDGVALARVHVIEPHGEDKVPFYTLARKEIPAERARFATAQAMAAAQLDALVLEVTARVGAAPANIFTAQRIMLEDPALTGEIETLIAEEGINAEMATLKITSKYEHQLRTVENDYFRERVSDIVEIRQRLLACLRGAENPVPRQASLDLEFGDYRIIVAEELTASETVSLDTNRVAGFITERGGHASHAAILARALGIPAVSGIPHILDAIPHGQEVLLNGGTGEVVLSPGATTLRVYPAARRRGANPMHAVPPVDGICVHANISLSGETAQALAMLAEGIGLYRTEFEFLAAGRLLNEEEQYLRYSAVVRAMEGRPVSVRLFDFGADKEASFLDMDAEENPCLGFRGARLLLGRPDIFLPQARALARASVHGPVRVVYPMIVDVEQFLVLRERFIQSTADIPGTQLQHGVMFEVPSACVEAREIFEVAEFGSIGSNDLIQYLFAVDRNNERVAHDYSADKPALWRVLSTVALAAQDASRPLSLCGEMGGQPKYLPRLVELGIRTVSVSPRLIGLARMAARRGLKR